MCGKYLAKCLAYSKFLVYGNYSHCLGPIFHFKAEKFYITQTFSFASQPRPLWPLHRFYSQMALKISWQRWTLVALSLLSSSFMILMRRLCLCAETSGRLADWRGQPHLNHMEWFYEKEGFYYQKTRLTLLYVEEITTAWLIELRFWSCPVFRLNQNIIFAWVLRKPALGWNL